MRMMDSRWRLISFFFPKDVSKGHCIGGHDRTYHDLCDLRVGVDQGPLEHLYFRSADRSVKSLSHGYSRPCAPGREHSWRPPLIPCVSNCAIFRGRSCCGRSRSCKVRKSEEQSSKVKGKHGLENIFSMYFSWRKFVSRDFPRAHSTLNFLSMR
jgi:hypothetical protein